MRRPSHRRALVLGRAKDSAEMAMDRFRDAWEFVYLRQFSEADAERPTEQLLDDVDAEMARRPFAAAVVTSESNMVCAGLLRSQYGWPGLDYERSLRGTNKWRMRQTLRGVVPAPRAWLSGAFLSATAADGSSTGPAQPPTDVVVKPLASSSARGVQRFTRPEARRWLGENPGLWLVEEVADVERELHCDGIVGDGRLLWFEVSEYDCPVLISTGVRSTHITAHEDPLRRRLMTATERILLALGHSDGVFHAEFLIAGDRFSFGEIGLRPAGAKIADFLRRMSGADLWGAFVASQLGDTTAGYVRPGAAAELAGSVLARPSPEGVPPVARELAARLDGVIHIEDGELARGATPSDVNQFEYAAYFSGLTPDGVVALRAAVAGAGDG